MLHDPLLRESYDPHWTEPDFGTGGGIDHLRVETLSEAILADLLPGINNQTRRARYYSFWAWVLRDFILDDQATHTQSGFYEWLRRREDALILAYLSHGCGGSAAGTDQGNKVWAGGEEATYPVDWKSLLSVDGGAYQLYYSGVLQDMNITNTTDDSPHDNLTKTVGLGLAEAYEDAVAGTRYVHEYLDATRLARTDIEEFARVGCLCQVHAHPLERTRLIDAFFRFDTRDAYAVKRLATLCYFLELIDQSGDQPLASQYDFRSAMYFWAYGNHHAYSPEGNMIDPAQRWRIFQLRQYYVFAIECFWAIFLHRIRDETWRAEEYLAWLLTELDLDTLSAEFGVHLRTTDPRVLTWYDLHQSVRKALPPQALEPGPAACGTSLNEHALFREIWSERFRPTAQVAGGGALLMFVLMYWRSQAWQNQAAWVYTTERFGADRLPFEGYLRHVQRAFDEGWSVARWLGWFHHRYLWLQHRRVALEKLITRERNPDTSQFELVDGAPGQSDRSDPWITHRRFRGTGGDSPKLNAPRFPSALNILSDLEVIEPTPEGGYKLTGDGAALLERFREYTVPKWEEPEGNETTDGAEEAAGG